MKLPTLLEFQGSLTPERLLAARLVPIGMALGLVLTAGVVMSFHAFPQAGAFRARPIYWLNGVSVLLFWATVLRELPTAERLDAFYRERVQGRVSSGRSSLT